ncbi:photosystem II protein Y [Lyngbya confervoides]|uniref:Photosystem II reaction center protein Y n=1 Tax=Lyngbya confervoides BDU141951 TaxID=1574623 RepID=A0ABD4SY48_9CYAN|nr:photosystem II protein Y [Lyngbya confervoides]MCM1981277.1 photosystem II protein Y [Lyngbya confervoides BDU141951]
MDLRVLIVLAPLLIAAAWALKNILPAALQQFSKYLNKD